MRGLSWSRCRTSVMARRHCVLDLVYDPGHLVGRLVDDVVHLLLGDVASDPLDSVPRALRDDLGEARAALLEKVESVGGFCEAEIGVDARDDDACVNAQQFN